MGVAHNALAWAACIVAIGLPVGILVAIKLQEDRERKGGDASRGAVDSASYLRRYRFFWASIPMAFFLLLLVGLPLITCHDSGRCYADRWTMLLLLISLVLGLFAWSLNSSLIYNRYFHSSATRPFRFVRGAERTMLFSTRAMTVVAMAVMVTAVLR